jgi:hypothetical protein
MSNISLSSMGFIYPKKFNLDVYVDENHDEPIKVIIKTKFDGDSTKIKSIKIDTLFYLEDLTEDQLLEIENEVRRKFDEGSIVLPRYISINDIGVRSGKIQEKFFDWE